MLRSLKKKVPKEFILRNQNIFVMSTWEKSKFNINERLCGIQNSNWIFPCTQHDVNVSISQKKAGSK